MVKFNYETSETRFKYPTDIAELERRWKVTREAMAKDDIDCLVMANFNRLFGGMSRYLTDIASPLYPLTSLFHRDPDKGISVFMHGERNSGRVPSYQANKGLKDNICTPYLPSICYSDNYLAVEAVKVIKRYGYQRLGFYAMNTIPAAFYLYLRENLPGVEFVDMSRTLDLIKAVKSEYETGMWQKSVDIHDQLMAAVPCLIRPGRTEHDVASDIIKMAMDLDCEDFNVMTGADPLKPCIHNCMLQNNVIHKGDAVVILIEVAAPSGIWAECGRVFSLGAPDPELVKAYETNIALQDMIAAKAAPGTKASEVYDALQIELAARGYLPETRFCAHGQSYDVVDRPIFVPEEDMTLQEGMFFAAHPTVANERVSCFVCDNFIVEKGGARRMSKTPVAFREL